MNTKEYLSDIRPFELYKDLYFVGSTKVSVHVLRTQAGLVMIDTGYPDMYDQILDSMRYLGLDPTDLCAIFHSHGHIDHFGGTVRLKAISGAKTYISRIDHDIVNGTYDLSWAKELAMPRPEPFTCDVLAEDGDQFTFGDITIRCRLTPGHTDGVLSFFITLPDGTVAAMHGGVGMNSLRGPFLRAYGLSLDCREKFRQGLHDLASERVDLVLGNHPGQNQTRAKLNAVQNGESCLDPEEWQRFLLEQEKKLDCMIRDEQNT